MKLALGKLDPQFPHQVAYFTDYIRQKPPAPRDKVGAPAISNWGMLGNDANGDCVMAGSAHGIMTYNALVGTSDPVPDEQAVLELYYQLTGGADTGLVIAQALKEWQQKGFWSNKIAGYAPTRLRSVPELQLAIDLFGLAKLGIQCPESAQEQFAAGQPWTYVKGSPVEGGHDVEAVGYDATYVYVVTWGELHPVAYSFLAHYQDEAWAIISQEYVEAGRGPTLDLDALRRDLPQLRTW